MSWPHVSMDINLGQILVISVVSALGHGMYTIFKAVKAGIADAMSFIRRIHENDDLLDATAHVVDDHTRALVRAELLKLPVLRLARSGRRVSDPPVFIDKDDLL